MSRKIQINRPSSESIPFKEDFKIVYTKESQSLIDEDTKRNCRILEFSREWSLREILITISKLEPEVYENLFVFIIEDKNFELPRKDLHKVPRIVELIFEFLVEFGESKKPLLLQLRSKAQSLTKVYFKDKNSTKFIDIQQELVNKSESFNDFPSFIWFFKNKPCQNFEDLVIQKIPKIKNFELIMKFLQTLELTEDFNDKLVLKCAAEGTKNDFLTAIDAKCDDKGKIINFNAQTYLTDQLNNTSVISTAIRGSNKEVTHYLLKHCTDLIQQLPFEQQVEASTAAIETGQPGILFDLLQRSDFPFPKDFNPKLITDKRILKVVDDRDKFYKAIAKEDKEAISKFINNNPSIKFGYDPMNESVMSNALRFKKFESFFYLKSHGFRALEFDNFSEKITDDKEKKKANKFARLQRIENVKISLADKKKAVMLIATRTFIYCRQDVIENEEEYRKKIKDWYMDIYKVKFGSQMLEAASQCENLKLVFDFECDSVENVDVSASSKTLGSTYPVSKWIFVGAKSSESENREQQIKGVIAHEICHYVMRLVYQNNENPYYKDGDHDCQRFVAIVTAIELMLFPQKEQEEAEDGNLSENQSDEGGNEDIQDEIISDECAGIISTVYNSYNRKDFHPELIVRPIHIYAQFDNDEELTAYLVDKYKMLFDYFEQVVIPELEKFNLKQREKVKKFNEFVGVLCEIESLDYEFASLKDITSIIDSHLMIITTNVPKLLFLNVYKHLDQTRKNMLEEQNVFIAPDILKNSYIIQEFKTIVNQKVNLNIFVDCSKEITPKLKSLIINESSYYIFIVSNYHCSKDLVNIFKDIKLNVSEKAVNYEWNDLALKSQKDLLQTEVNFQNNSTLSIYDLISSQNNLIGQQETFEEFGNVIDEDFLDLLINEAEINVNIENVDKKEVDVLYRSRNFIQNSPNEGASEVSIQKYSEEQMISEAANKNYVLISDIAGAGKSESVKNMLLIFGDHYSKYWITFIDLRQFVNDLRLVDESMNILRFLDEKILSQKTKFERNVFKNLYENGQVCLIVDEFDKISANDQEIIAKLFRTFNCSRGNKLWIITREYCEPVIKNILELDITYKLDDFGQNYGIDLIASSWVLNEMECNINTQSRKEIINQLKNSPNFTKYQENAQSIVKKILITDNHSFGSKLPQFYKIVAEIFKNNKCLQINFTILKVYAEYVKIQYEKWLYKSNESIRNQNNQSKYFKIHQLIAMQITFPKDSHFLDFDELGWTDEEIIDCNFLNKIGDSFVFHYDIFRDYFIADYMIRILKKKGNKVADDFCLYLIQVLTTPKFKIVRMFLNEALSDVFVSNCIGRKMENLRKRFCKHSDQLVNLSQIFKENHEQIANLLISILHQGNPEDITKILSNNIGIFSLNEKSSISLLKFQEFMNKFLDSGDFNWLIQKVLSKICDSSLDIQDVECFLKVIEEKKGLNFIKEAIKLQDEKGRNLVHKFAFNLKENVQKLQTFVKFLESFLEEKEIVEMLQQTDHDGLNIIHICVIEKKKLKYLWIELKILYVNYNSLEEFEKLCIQKTLKNKQNILHFAVNCNNLEFHEELWKLLLQDFLFEKLKDLIIQKDENSNNFMHYLLIKGEETVNEFTLKTFKESFSRDQNQEILKSKGTLGRSLLHRAACHIRSIKVHNILWSYYQETWNNNELFDTLKEHDENGENVLQIAAIYSTTEVLAFYIQEIEKISSQEEIKKSFMTLELATEIEKNHIKFHKSEAIQKYLTVEDQVKDESDTTDNTALVISSNIETQSNDIVWYVIKKFFICENFTQEFNRIARIESSEKLISVYKNLDSFGKSYNDNEFQETLWELLLTIFEREELKNLLIHNYENDLNFMHVLIANWTVDKIEFTLNQIEANFNENQLQEILNVEGPLRRNLLQTALCESKDIELFKIIWKTVENACISHEIFVRILVETDYDGNNVFHLAACFTSSEIFEFIFEELENKLSKQNINHLLIKHVFEKKSLLISAAKENTDPELHKSLWKIMQKYFNSSEILKIMKYIDNIGNTFLLNAVYYNNKAIIEISLDEVEKMTNTEDLNLYEYLMRVNNMGNNIFKVCADSKNEEKLELLCFSLKKYLTSHHLQLLVAKIHYTDRNILNIASICSSINFHKILRTFLGNNFGNAENLYSLLSAKNEYNNNFLHVLIIFIQNEETIEFVFNQIKDKLNYIQYKEIVKSKGNGGRNLLQLTCKSPNVYKHKFLWNTFQKICGSDTEFVELLKEVDVQGYNVIQNGVRYSTSIVLDYFIEELELILPNEEIKKLLSTFDNENLNILQVAATYNFSRNLNVLLLKIIEKYFNSDEIVDMMANVDKNLNNLLFNLIYWNRHETVNTIWYAVARIFLKTGKSLLKYLKSVNNVGENILHILVRTKNVDKLKFMWVEIENIFKVHKSSQQFEELISQKTKNNLNVIQLAAKSDDIEFLETLWGLLLETFGSLQQLENFMFQEEETENSFLDLFMSLDKTDLVRIKMTNLLQNIASNTKSPERYKIFWIASRKICKSDKEFLEFIQEQKFLFNILKNALNFTTTDIIEFTIKELQEISTPNQIRDILRQQDHKSQNLLQQSVVFRKPLEFYENLWKIFHSYFKPHEILDIINNYDYSENNLLFNAVRCKNIEIINHTWIQIKNILKNNEIENAQHILKRNNKNILHELINIKDENILKYLWKELEENFGLFKVAHYFENLFFDRITNENQNVLQLTVFCDRIEFHEAFWELLLKTFENREDLIKLITQKDNNGNNFIHLLVMYSKSKLIEFILNNIKNNIKSMQYLTILKSKGNCNKNLLQLAVCFSNEIETIQFLFIDLKNIYFLTFIQFGNKNELLENFTNVDIQHNNIFHLAACFSTSTIFTFLIEPLQKLTSDENVRVILNNLGFAKQNLLQKAAVQNTSLEFHVNLWTILRTFLNSTEILEMIKHSDEYGHNLLLSAVKCNSKEIVELIWENIKMYVDKREDQVEYLDSVGHSGKNLEDLCLENRVDVISMRICVQNLIMEYKINSSLA